MLQKCFIGRVFRGCASGFNCFASHSVIGPFISAIAVNYNFVVRWLLDLILAQTFAFHNVSFRRLYSNFCLNIVIISKLSDK